jgi:hypothetical protein
MNLTESPLLTEPLRRIEQRMKPLDLSPRRKHRVTITMPIEILERLRGAVYWTPGMTIAALVSIALTKQLDDMESENASPFPKRAGKLKPGRPRNPRNPVSNQIRSRIQMDNVLLQT